MAKGRFVYGLPPRESEQLRGYALIALLDRRPELEGMLIPRVRGVLAESA